MNYNECFEHDLQWGNTAQIECPLCHAEDENTALRAQVAKQTQRLHELTCNECDSRVMDDGYCMMGHWCGKPML